MKKKVTFVCSIALCLLYFSLSYAEESLPSEDKIAIEFKIVCDFGRPDCIKAIKKDKYEELFVETISLLSIDDIASAELNENNSQLPEYKKQVLKKMGGKISPFPGIRIQLKFNEKGKLKITEITSENIGRRMAIFIDGELIIAPKIYEAITGGALEITGNFTKEKAQGIVERINKAVT